MTVDQEEPLDYVPKSKSSKPSFEQLVSVKALDNTVYAIL